VFAAAANATSAILDSTIWQSVGLKPAHARSDCPSPTASLQVTSASLEEFAAEPVPGFLGVGAHEEERGHVDVVFAVAVAAQAER
jgi:hypothetical protein